MQKSYLIKFWDGIQYNTETEDWINRWETASTVYHLNIPAPPERQVAKSSLKFCLRIQAKRRRRGHPEVVPDLEPDWEPENVQLHCLTIQNITMIMVANLGVLWWKILLKNIHGWKDQGSFKFVWIDWLHADGMQYLKWLLRHHSQSWTLNCHKGCEILLEFWFD